MSVFYDLSKTPRKILNQAIVKNIVAESNGTLLDPSDMSTLYQDAAGTTPVTAVEQPVGLVLDKSQGLMLGPELIVNGTFDSNLSGWSTPAGGWYWEDGKAKIIGDGSLQTLAQYAILSSSKFYLVTFDATVSGSGTFALQNAGGTAYMYVTTGRMSCIFTGSITIAFKRISGATTVTLDNISVRELYGYHATQSITASRPTLSARYNLLTKTGDFSDAVWGKVGTGGVTMLSNVATAPDGTTTAGKLIANPVAGTHYIQQAVTYTASAPHTCAIYIKAAEVSSLRLFLFSTAYGTTFNANTGVFSGTTVGLTTYAAQIVDGWWMVSLTATAPSSPVNRLEIYTADNSAGDGVSGIYIWHPDLRLGTTAGPYQRVNTATDYDTDERYFKKYLRFDGIDDYLNLPYMGLYANGSASVVTTMSSLGYGGTADVVAERSTSIALPVYTLLGIASASINSGGYIRADSGSLLINSIASSGEIISPLVIKTIIDSGSSIKKYINSNNADTDNYVRTGTLSLTTTTIGAANLASVANFLTGNLYGLIITKSALNDAQRVRCERFLARKAGVML